MKKILLFCGSIIMATATGYSQSEVTIAAWTCPTGVDTVDIFPDICIPENEGYYLSAEDTVAHPNTNRRDVTFTDGANTFAAMATGWDGGEGSKLWSVKIKAPEMSDLKVYSKQSSSATYPGPRDWKIQARLSGEDWVDIPDGVITCSNDWGTGIATALELPAEFNNPSSSVYIRWIMTTNISTNGTEVAADGISKIDDIFITGFTAAGTEEVIFSQGSVFYPNPCENGQVYITENNKFFRIEICNLQGQIVKTVDNAENLNSINVESIVPGTYLVRAMLTDGSYSEPQKLIIR